MLVRVVYGAGRVLARVAYWAVLIFLGMAVAIRDQDGPSLAPVWVVALIVVGLPAAVVVHEAAHLLACLALRVKVRGVEFGNGKSAWLRRTVGGVEVVIGAPYSGRVLYDDTSSAGRRAVIIAAGPLSNVIAAAALFAAGQRQHPGAAAAPFTPGQPGDPVAAAVLFAAGHAGNLGLTGLALVMALTGVQNLLPYRTRSGRASDGARLLGLAGGQFAAALRPRDARGWLPLAGTPAALNAEYKEMVRRPDRPLPREGADRWLRAYWERETLALHMAGFAARSLRLDGRISELLALHADLPRPAGQHVKQLTIVAHALDWEVLLVPGLPAEAVNRAVGRVEGTLRNAEFEPAPKPWNRAAVLHTLALGRLRQGRLAEAEAFSRAALAVPGLDPRSRATVLATIALAGRAAGLSYEGELAEARFLDPDADLVAEASGARQVQGV